jgi:hypothetical protein
MPFCAIADENSDFWVVIRLTFSTIISIILNLLSSLSLLILKAKETLLLSSNSNVDFTRLYFFLSSIASILNDLAL